MNSKLIKRGIVSVLSLSMIIGTMCMAGAAEITSNTTSNTEVNYTANTSQFSVAVPAVISVSDEETPINVTSSYINIRPDEQISVSISAGHTNGVVTLSRELKNSALDDKTTMTTTISRSDAAITTSTLVGKFIDSTGTANKYVNAVKLSQVDTTNALDASGNVKAGTYRGSVTFKIARESYNDAN